MSGEEGLWHLPGVYRRLWISSQLHSISYVRCRYHGYAFYCFLNYDIHHEKYKIKQK